MNASRDRARLARWIAWSVVTAAAVGSATHVVLVILRPDATTVSVPLVDGLQTLPLLALAVVGALIIRRHPGLSVGWLLLAASLEVFELVLRRYWQTASPLGIGRPTPVVAWLASWLWLPPTITLSTLVPLLFPTGRLVSARWRVVVWAAVLAIVLGSVGTAFGPGTLQFNTPLASIENPFGVPGFPENLGSIGLALWAVAAVASAASFGIRLRRARGVERLQLRWFGYAFTLLLVAIAIGLAGGAVVGLQTIVPILGALVTLALTTLAIACGIAILRYRLYDIDVLIRRTLVYGALTTTLAGTYAATVVLFQAALRPVTGSSELAVAASTLATLALFQPLRRQIQNAVDRRFFRARYDLERTLDAFGERLRDEVELEAVEASLLGAVEQTVHPSQASVWLRERAS